MSNKLDLDYQNLLKDILENGAKKETRNGGTISVFGRQIRHKMSDGFPLLTTKKMAWKSMVVELLWFLQGDTNIKYLVKNGCHIWDGDAFKRYEKYVQSNPLETRWHKILSFIDTGNSVGGTGRAFTKEEFIEKIKTDDEFAEKWGELGPVYGKQWRKWDSCTYEGEIRVFSQIDQIQNLINDLKNNPDSRRLMVTAWNPSDIPNQVLPPCHYGFQCYTKELTLDERIEITSKHPRFDVGDFGIGNQVTDEHLHEVCNSFGTPSRSLSMSWNQRSIDTFLGLPFNIASYGLLLIMLADEVNMIPDELIGNLGDTHLYLNHLEQAKEQISREPFELPEVKVQDGMYCSSVQDVILLNYQAHPKIEAPLSN